MTSRYWMCNGQCGVSIGHVHYGENVVLALGQQLTPAMLVADELLAVAKAAYDVLSDDESYNPLVGQLADVIEKAEQPPAALEQGRPVEGES